MKNVFFHHAMHTVLSYTAVNSGAMKMRQGNSFATQIYPDYDFSER